MEPHVVGMFSTQKLSLIAIGTPSNGPNDFADWYLSKESVACVMATSGVNRVKQFKSGRDLALFNDRSTTSMGFNVFFLNCFVS